MILVKHCQDGAGGSNVRISRVDSDFVHKAAGRCLECRVQAYRSLWLKSISVTADSVGPAAPGVVQWRNTIRSSSALYSGQAPGTQQGLARRQLQLGMGSDDLGQALPGWSRGLQLENQQGRLRFPAQGSWSLSRALSLGEERGFSQ